MHISVVFPLVMSSNTHMRIASGRIIRLAIIRCTQENLSRHSVDQDDYGKPTMERGRGGITVEGFVGSLKVSKNNSMPDGNRDIQVHLTPLCSSPESCVRLPIRITVGPFEMHKSPAEVPKFG